MAGGEWSSICNVDSHVGGISGFKVRPKTFTRHGRQLVKTKDNKVFLNVAKVGKLKARSLRPTFAVCRGTDRNAREWRVVVDLMGRTYAFYNSRDELVALMAKTNKTMILNAVLGVGSENTIDVAPGVDCSVVLAAIFGVLQCGASVLGDAFSNFVVSPMQDMAVDEGMNQITGEEEADDEGDLEGEEVDLNDEYEFEAVEGDEAEGECFGEMLNALFGACISGEE